VAAAALVLIGIAALVTAVRIGAAAAREEGDLLAQVRARTEQRVAAERDQLRAVWEAEAGGDRDGARRVAEAALGGLDGNSQLHLYLGDSYRAAGSPAPALREYRRAVELLRDYTDRRSPRYIGTSLGPWLREIRGAVSGPVRADLYYLERALAGGCA
jgi:tetratricopeptide (TPR) repeat protein